MRAALGAGPLKGGLPAVPRLRRSWRCRAWSKNVAPWAPPRPLPSVVAWSRLGSNTPGCDVRCNHFGGAEMAIQHPARAAFARIGRRPGPSLRTCPPPRQLAFLGLRSPAKSAVRRGKTPRTGREGEDKKGGQRTRHWDKDDRGASRARRKAGGLGAGGRGPCLFLGAENETRRHTYGAAEKRRRRKETTTNANTKQNQTLSTYFTPANPFLPSPSCFLYYHLFYLSCNHERSTVETTGL